MVTVISERLATLVCERVEAWWGRKLPAIVAQITSLGVPEALARERLTLVQERRVHPEGLTVELSVEWGGISFDEIGGEEVFAQIETILGYDAFVALLPIPEAAPDSRYSMGVFMHESEK